MAAQERHVIPAKGVSTVELALTQDSPPGARAFAHLGRVDDLIPQLGLKVDESRIDPRVLPMAGMVMEVLQPDAQNRSGPSWIDALPIDLDVTGIPRGSVRFQGPDGRGFRYRLTDKGSGSILCRNVSGLIIPRADQIQAGDLGVTLPNGQRSVEAGGVIMFSSPSGIKLMSRYKVDGANVTASIGDTTSEIYQGREIPGTEPIPDGGLPAPAPAAPAGQGFSAGR